MTQSFTAKYRVWGLMTGKRISTQMFKSREAARQFARKMDWDRAKAIRMTVFAHGAPTRVASVN